jgi:hypothetical protein
VPQLGINSESKNPIIVEAYNLLNAGLYRWTTRPPVNKNAAIKPTLAPLQPAEASWRIVDGIIASSSIVFSEKLHRCDLTT